VALDGGFLHVHAAAAVHVRGRPPLTQSAALPWVLAPHRGGVAVPHVGVLVLLARGHPRGVTRQGWHAAVHPLQDARV